MYVCVCVLFFGFWVFFRAAPQNIEVPRLWGELELQAYVTATANARSEAFLQPTLQLTATPDP